MPRNPLSTNQLRIIGGRFRSRRLTFPDVEGLRPTGDRIRETLFNWLAADIAGARCLDLFAGSGALGLEALSRGAAEVLFIEHSAKAYEQLQHNLQLLGVGKTAILRHADSLAALPSLQPPFDVVFLDPPFASPLLAAACHALEQHHLLKPGSLIYLEHAKTAENVTPPPTWQLHRDKTSGLVRYQLYRRS